MVIWMPAGPRSIHYAERRCCQSETRQDIKVAESCLCTVHRGQIKSIDVRLAEYIVFSVVLVHIFYNKLN